jgi:ribosomal protein S20
MSKKSQEKNRIRQIKNKEYKISIKKNFKKVINCLQKNDLPPSELETLVIETQRALDKGAKKRVISKNKASRKKSILHKLFFSSGLHDRQLSTKKK